MNRQIPNGFDKNDFIENINNIKILFNERWLNKNPTKNIFKRLWHRKDFLASSELYIIGLGISKLKKNNYNSWLDDLYKQVNKNNESTIYGIFYELFIYVLYQNKIELAEPNQAHYDLKIIRGKQVIYASIKKLTTSEKEKNLYKDFITLEQFYIKELKKNKLNGISLYLNFNNYEYFSLNNAKKIIKDTITKKKNLSHNKYFTVINEIKCNADNFLISKGKISYQFNLLIPYNDKEEKRFINLFKKASNNLNKVDECNLVIIGLSSTIDMKGARKWLLNEFEKTNYTRISGVLLTQYLPVQNNEENSTHLNLQFNFILNMKAKYKIDYTDEIFEIKLPIGTVSTKSANLNIITDNHNFEISEYYTFQSGYKLCEYFFGKMEYNFSYVPNLKEETLILNHIIKPIRPIGDKCVLL